MKAVKIKQKNEKMLHDHYSSHNTLKSTFVRLIFCSVSEQMISFRRLKKCGCELDTA